MIGRILTRAHGHVAVVYDGKQEHVPTQSHRMEGENAKDQTRECGQCAILSRALQDPPTIASFNAKLFNRRLLCSGKLILAYCRVDVEVQSEYGAELRKVQLVTAIQKSTMSALKGSASLLAVIIS